MCVSAGMRRWCYETFGDSNAIQLVVMATPEDINANAEFIHLADELVKVRDRNSNCDEQPTGSVDMQRGVHMSFNCDSR